jgi:hypothetical protein
VAWIVSTSRTERFVLHGQAPPAANASASLDVVGFRPGMSLQEAYNALKAYNPKAPIQAGEEVVPEISPKPLPYALVLPDGGTANAAEKIELDITLPPGRQMVWRVTRQINFQVGGEPAAESLMAALRQKYGQEHVVPVATGGLSWYFDERGQRADLSRGAPLFNCQSVLPPLRYGQIPLEFPPAAILGAINSYRQTLNRVSAPAACRSLILVTASIRPDADQRLADMMLVHLTDVGMWFRGWQATYDHIARVQAGQEKQELEKAQQRGVPKL